MLNFFYGRNFTLRKSPSKYIKIKDIELHVRWWKKREIMLCWMNVNWIIVVKVEIESCKYVYRFEWELGERWWKKWEREYAINYLHHQISFIVQFFLISYIFYRLWIHSSLHASLIPPRTEMFNFSHYRNIHFSIPHI